MKIITNFRKIKNSQPSTVAIGSFDGVHLGHQKILQRINRLATEINGESVVITFHPHPRSVIYPKDQTLKLLHTIDEKMQLTWPRTYR